MPHTRTVMTLRPSPVRRSAFTLVELMVSIALALLLLVGINKVFKTTTDTVGTGYATSQVMRQQMAVDRAFDHTFAYAASPSQQPFILIHSQQQYAFMDRKDLNSDKDGDWSTADFAATGTESAVQPANYNSRSHRIDTLSFFASDINNPFHRVTGDHNSNTGLVSNEYSPEAFIRIGHLRLPNNSANPDPSTEYFDPAQGTSFNNPNNFFVTDWALGQQTLLLKADPAVDFIFGAGALAPISNTSTANFSDLSLPNGHGKVWTVADSRIDVAKTTIGDYRTQIIEKLGTGTLPAAAVAALDYRFNAKPWVTKPASSPSAAYMQVITREMALTTPYLFRGCSQFMVEFAGDFVTQDNNPASATFGNVTATKPDGVVDFVGIGSGASAVRRTRWYGFPRDVAGPISAANPTGGPDGHIRVTDGDVVPLRDFASAPYPFESNVNVTLPQKADYMAAGGLPIGATYVCAWGPDQLDPTKADQYVPPTMFRIVMQLTDSQGRLGEGPVSEFVYKFGR